MKTGDVFTLHRGASPLVVSVPHDGREIPDDIAARMSDAALSLPDTDWHVARLYAFCRDLGASLLVARYSRYVVDLNRPANDATLYPGQMSTGLCPSRTFAGENIYQDGATVSDEERERRTAKYWAPYHETLRSLLDERTKRHGVALLWDAHSIASQVPALFDGQLPELNIGTNAGESCERRLASRLVSEAEASPYSVVVDGRFRGGYITRHYGRPQQRVHAVQLELSQRCYLHEETGGFDAARAGRLVPVLSAMLRAYVAAASP